MRATIGDYRVIDQIGAGGMGTVYRVAHRRTGRVLAAKVMHAEAVGPSALERFRNEARIHQALSHPHIAAVHEYLELDGVPCLVLEYVEGETLEERLQRAGPLPLDEALRLFAALVDAVGYVHHRGVVHRDLKTSNVKLDTQGAVKLLDFGIATSAGVARLTTTGNVVGTLLALSPEQLRTGHAEPRSDIWALGILLYEMLTGRPPFDGVAPGLLTERILHGRYVPPSQRRPELPREIDRVVERCLRVRVEDRYASCEAVLTDVRAVRTVRPAPGAATVSGSWATIGADMWRGPAALLGQSGEVAQSLAREWRLAGSVLAAAVALLFFVWAVWPSGPKPRPPELPPLPPRGGPATNVPAAIVPAVARTDVPGAPVRELLIRVTQGEADVYRDGLRAGRTPYRLRAPIGAEVSMVLRRDGCGDLALKLRVEEGMDEFIESMPRCRTP